MKRGYTEIRNINSAGCGLLSPKMEIIYDPKNFKSITCVDKDRVKLIYFSHKESAYGDYEGNIK